MLFRSERAKEKEKEEEKGDGDEEEGEEKGDEEEDELEEEAEERRKSKGKSKSMEGSAEAVESSRRTCSSSKRVRVLNSDDDSIVEVEANGKAKETGKTNKEVYMCVAVDSTGSLN